MTTEISIAYDTTMTIDITATNGAKKCAGVLTLKDRSWWLTLTGVDKTHWIANHRLTWSAALERALRLVLLNIGAP